MTSTVVPSGHIPQSRIANKAQLAEFFGAAVPTVDSWIRRGMPVLVRGSRGTAWEIDLLAAAEWRFATPVDPALRDDPDKLTPKDRLDYWRAEREKTRHQAEQGELIPVLDVEQKFASTYKALAQAIETFPDKAERERGISPDVILLLQDLGDELRDALYVAATTATAQAEGQ